jgi:SAM-dependent methyltransferase
MKEIRLEPRSCECCGSNNSEDVWNSSSVVARAKNKWKFPYHISICQDCGFTYASPAPIEGDLLEYHAEGLTGYKNIPLPYSIEKRLHSIERHATKDGIFVEIGGDLPEKFHQHLSKIFSNIISVEIAEDTPGDHRSLYDLEEDTVDMIAHYDVLEHIGNVKEFVNMCSRALKVGGIMVCEMPDIRLYPKNLLLLEFEHVNHFSITTLSKICGKYGLRLIESGHNCSRPYGLLGIFEKQYNPIDITYSYEIEVLDAKACVEGGIYQIQQLNNYLADVRHQLRVFSQEGKTITIWAVNDILRRLLDGFKLPKGCIIVDADPRRKDDLSEDGIIVSQPEEQINHIRNSDVLIISAARYQRSICSWIEEKVGVKFTEEKLIVLGGAAKENTLT